MYVVFRCTDCGRFLYTKESNKTRKCPCGKVVKIKKAKKITEVQNGKEAGEIVRKLQEKEYGEPFFGRYKENE
ncbi:DUF1922 domain-containing protein [archaeon SCG-AAA382B04]|nr:DUF1922 domain-containing protein [archaeon SCG-AAA382B04]